MSPNKLAVLIPTYNSAQFVADTLESLATCGGRELGISVYVFDDRSTDKTLEIVDQWRDSLALHVIRNEQNLGEGENVNRAMVFLEQQGMEWAMLLHHDDLMVGPWLEVVLETMERERDRAGMICCHNSYSGSQEFCPATLPRPSSLEYTVHPGGEQSVRNLRHYWFWTPSGSAIRVKAYVSVGGMHPRLPYAGDNDFLCRFMLAGYDTVEVKWPAIHKRYQRNSQTGRAVEGATDLIGWEYIMHKYLYLTSKGDRTLEYYGSLKRVIRRTLSFVRRGNWAAVLAQLRGLALVIQSYCALVFGVRSLLPSAVSSLLNYSFTPLSPESCPTIVADPKSPA